MPPIDNMAKSNRITTDMVWAAMSFPKLMRCLDKLMYPEMAVIHKEIYQNLAAILSPFGMGHAGYLGIMMPEAFFVQHFNDPFQPPINSGKSPDDIPASSSAQQWSKLLIHHTASKLVYDTFKAVTKCLQNQFPEVIHEDYLA